ncbi:MAG: hypothetical protein NC393_04545 [Clostridium sp.]|nr:hypothetical protein [Clostridium sp.]MCM1207735.1 hypothetical protein [Ruminococcus sp.]
MSWNYAELSKTAKQVGGPEKLVDSLIESGKNSGRKEMYPIIGVAAIGASVLTVGIEKAIDYFKKKNKKKKEVSSAEVEDAKKELINGIREYDEKHPNEDVDDGTVEDVPL